MAVTQPMAFDYEISAAICYMLMEDYDELVVDIPRGEDSLFYRDTEVSAIGEAKNWSGEPWSTRQLFHRGKTLGPLLQLWIRKKTDSVSIIFSTIGTKCPLAGNRLRPKTEDLTNIVDTTRDLDELHDDENYTLTKVREFLDTVLFFEWPHPVVKSQIHKWCRDHDIQIANGGIERAIALFQDETYYPRKRIKRSEVINALSVENLSISKPTREYYTDTGGVVVVSLNCYGKIALKLGSILDLHRREMRASWYKPTSKVNDYAIGVLKERLESLKDLQFRCGSPDVGEIIALLEKNPHDLFRDSKNEELLRNRIRKSVAEFTKLEHDPIHSITGTQL
ncbi:MAG: hypothetical protein JW779_11365 [Candidatus Thorarchaeota archaeon]|nr:hypothetical protein [Candidatus Thorarchaeota archaeon]